MATRDTLFDGTAESTLRSIPAPDPHTVHDVAYRIAAPFDLEPAVRARRTCIFLTSEHRYVPTSLMARGEPFAKAVARTDTHIVTPSRWSRDGLLLAGADPDRVTVIPHGVDCGTFRPSTEDEREAWRRTNGVPSESLTFLHVGPCIRDHRAVAAWRTPRLEGERCPLRLAPALGTLA
jgi:glycosyltransferase involved in cell wall biosynthesis